MSFTELKLKTEYRSLRDDIVKEFLNPVFNKSVLYKRAVGYFSSSALMILSEGIFDLIKNHGSIQLIISPQLSKDDFSAIKDGFHRHGNISSEIIWHEGNFYKKRLNFLSNLIATGILEIKIAEIERSNGLGRFNDKMGLFYDSKGNIIAFSGSMNESANGFTKNYDSIDIFTSFDDLDRIKAKETAFDSLWNNQEFGVSVTEFDFSRIKAFDYDEMSKIKSSDDIFNDIYDEKSFEKILFDEDESALSQMENAGSIVTNVLKRAIDLSESGELPGVPTGFYDFDKVTNGLQKSELILLAARPSMGKTALALNIALNAAKHKKSVAVFSLEMPKYQIGTRLLSSISGIPLTAITSGTADRGQLLDAVVYLEELPLYIDDTSSLTVSAIRSKAQKFKREHGLDLIVIDYVQLMVGDRNNPNRVQEVSDISRNLKGLAKYFNVPVLALSQLNRGTEVRADKRPQLSDLRESGSLEQDADIVMFLYRDEYYYRDESDAPDIAELNIAKNRNGATGTVRLHFSKATTTFKNLTRIEY